MWGIKADRVIAIGKLGSAKRAWLSMPATWLSRQVSSTCCLTPWGSLLVDGRSQGEIRQGVTTQIMGEGCVDGAT